jgi:AcrR family transcriptional regulator
MSPSRSKVTDDEIFEAVQRAMTQRSPHELTLAAVAAEAGVSPGRLPRAEAKLEASEIYGPAVKP